MSNSAAPKPGNSLCTPSQTAAASGTTRHMAHAQGWQAICTAPDFCKVGKCVVAFNSFATLDQPHTASATVKARGTAVYRQGDVIKQIQADAGKHIVSGTSLGSGFVKILEGHANVKVEGVPVARHDSRCLINCDATGVGGAQGKLVTEKKTVRQAAAPEAAGEAPAGSRTSAKLQELERAKARLESEMWDLDALDEYVDFKRANAALDEAIGTIKGKPGTMLDHIAQIRRGLLGFGKDIGMSAAEAAYEGMKLVPKLVRLTQTENGELLMKLEGAILAENLRLGNFSAEALGQGALQVGAAMAKPVTTAWANEQYFEAMTRGGAEVLTLGLGAIKSVRAMRAARAAAAARAAEAAKAAELARAAEAASAAEAAKAAELAKAAETASAATSGDSLVAYLDDGVHVKQRTKPKFSSWDNYKTHGVTDDPSLSPEGRRLIRQYEEQGMNETKAIKSARELMESGSSFPSATPIEIHDKLYKVIPEGGTVGAHSAYWVTGDEISALHGLSYDQVAGRLGLPLASQQGARFQVMEITALRNGTSFTSVIAPTSELGANGMIWSQSGGGLQTLLTDRSIFTAPILTTMTFP